MDRIILRDLAFFAYHGLYQAEAEFGQRFYIDLDCFLDLRTAGQSDNENDTLRYDHIAKRVEEVVLNQRFNLIEALAEAIAYDLLTHMQKMEAVRVKVRKPEAPVPAIVKDIAVEIHRTRKDYERDRSE